MKTLSQTLLLAALLGSSASLAKDRSTSSSSSSSCSAFGAMAEGAVAVGIAEADLATSRRACPRTELGLGVRGNAIIDTPNFYGAIGADGLLFGSWAYSDRLELYGSLELPKYVWTQNATLKGSELTVGNASVGATYVALEGGGLVLSPTARLLVPTSFAIPNGRVLGAEVGAIGRYLPMSALELHGYAGLDGTLAVTAAEQVPRGGASLLLGAQWAPLDWFSVVLDVQSHFGHRAALDYVAPAVGLRFALGKQLGAELDAWVPVVGEARQLAAGGFKLTYQL